MKRKSTILLGGLMVLSFSFTAFAENGRNLIQPASVATNSSATPLESKKRLRWTIILFSSHYQKRLTLKK